MEAHHTRSKLLEGIWIRARVWIAARIHRAVFQIHKCSQPRRKSRPQTHTRRNELANPVDSFSLACS